MELVGPTKPARVNRRMRDGEVAARLWTEAERLTGTSLPAPARRRLIAGSCAEAAGTFHQVRRRAFFSARA